MEQELARLRAELTEWQNSLDNQTEALEVVQADSGRLHLAYTALQEQLAGLEQKLARTEQERDFLGQSLSRTEQDLKALRASRTVRLATAVSGRVGKARRTWQTAFRKKPEAEIAAVPPPLAAPDEAGPVSPGEYEQWVRENESGAAAAPGGDAQLDYRPLISVVLEVKDATAEDLARSLAALTEQTYPRWEVVVMGRPAPWESWTANNPPVAGAQARRRFWPAEEGAGLPGEGEYSCFVEAGDTLSPSALFEVVALLNRQPELDLIYTDSDWLDPDGKRHSPFFKPGWSPEMLFSVDYVSALALVRTSRLQQIPDIGHKIGAGPRWNLMLELAEQSLQVEHLPKVLYHRAGHKGSGDGNPLVARPGWQQLPGEAGLRADWPVEGSPKVSIIIPTKNRLDLIQPCLDSLLEKTDYGNYEVLVADTGSTDPAVWDYYGKVVAQNGQARVKVLKYARPFNYSAVNNWAARQAEGELLLFLNNDTEVMEAAWLEEMVRWAQRGHIGIVGAKLLKRDGSIQHAGVVVGLGGFAGHVFAGLPENEATIFGRAEWYREYLAVTAACMLVRRKVFDRLGGFEEKFKLNGSDVDLCLRARQLGWRVFYTPFARLYHLESATHQGVVPPSDYALSLERYRERLAQGDPFFNPNLSKLHTRPTLKPRHEPAPLELARERLTRLTAAPQPTVAFDNWFWERYSLDAAYNARTWDFSPAELEQSRAVVAANRGAIDLGSITWFLPPFQHAYFGGIHTILRFAAYFKEARGVESRFVLVRPPADGPGLAALRQSMQEAFPGLGQVKLEAVQSKADLPALPPTDAAVATLWSTAYFALSFNQTRRKFYFIQDLEPLFYPAGTNQALAEATYRFGFYGLTNTIALKQIYEEEYGGVAQYFVPAVDTALFKPGPPLPDEPPYTLFFYGRPGQPRNAFELGLAALKKLKDKLGERVRIVTAGANWQPEQYGVEGVIENLGLLPYQETAALYRQCHAGFVMMFTRHPSYLPFELMACGTLVVTNENPATGWMLRHGQNCLLSAPSATCLAQTIEQGLVETGRRRQIVEQARRQIQQKYANWQPEMEKIFNFMVDPEKGRPGSFSE